MLQMSAMQLETYREIGLKALKREAEELPLAQLFVTILQKLGNEAESFAETTGTLSRF